MATTSANIPYRLGRVETRQETHADAIAQQGLTLAVHEERLTEHAKAIEQLAATVNKAIWALVGFALTIAGSAILLALTIGSAPHP